MAATKSLAVIKSRGSFLAAKAPFNRCSAPNIAENHTPLIVENHSEIWDLANYLVELVAR
jgi:hypothetical protein